MRTIAEIKAQERWEAKRIKQGWRRWHVFTTPDIIERLKRLYVKLKIN